MNLEQSDSYKEQIEQNIRNRKVVMLSIVLCGIFVTLLVALVCVISYQDSITEKMYFNDQQVAISPTFYVKANDGSIFVSVKELSAALGYTYYHGELDEFNEDSDSCYVTNQFETVTLTAGQNEYYKILDNKSGEKYIGDKVIKVANDDGYSERFRLEKNIELVNGEIYVPLESIKYMFNMDYNWQEYRHRFYTFEYILAANAPKVPNYDIYLNYYENLRSVLDGVMVVTNSNEKVKDTVYGLIDLATGKEIYGMKYTEFVYIQNAQEFFVVATDNNNEKTVGVVDIAGRIIIPNKEYDKISLLDDQEKLYLVQKDSEVGVIDKKGNPLIYCDYDSIGIEDTDKYPLVKVNNPKFLYNKVIPVEKDGKYGLVDLDGNLVAGVVYDDFGYRSSSKTTSGNDLSVLIIPPEVGIRGIVLNKNDLYGIFDTNTNQLAIPAVLTKVYAIRKDGNVEYYVEYNGQEIELSQLLIDNGVVSEKTSTKSKDKDIDEEDEEDVKTNSSEETENE